MMKCVMRFLLCLLVGVPIVIVSDFSITTAMSQPLCVNCNKRPKQQGHNFCGKTCVINSKTNLCLNCGFNEKYSGSAFCSKSCRDIYGNKFTQPLPSGGQQGGVQQQTLQQGQDIYFYESNKPYYEFTNYWPNDSFNHMGVLWKTSEHYFQALKFQYLSQQWNSIVNQTTADDARVEAGKLNHLVRSDWHTVLSNPQGFVVLNQPPQLDFKILNGGKYLPYLQQKSTKQVKPYGSQQFNLVNTEQFLLDEWKTGKVAAMYHVVKAKFTSVATLKQLLLNTGNVNLFENATKDDYWGLNNTPSKICYIPGLNMLGIVLMYVRDELRGIGVQQQYNPLPHYSQPQFLQQPYYQPQQPQFSQQPYYEPQQELLQWQNNLQLQQQELLQQKNVLRETLLEKQKLQESLEEKIKIWEKKLVNSEDRNELQRLADLLVILKQKLSQLLQTVIQLKN